MTNYAALWTKSNYSFLEGASHPGELVEQAHAFGIQSMSITDRDGVYGIVRAHVRAKELGMRMIYGSEITVHRADAPSSRVVLLAQDRSGYRQLCRLISLGRARSPKGSSAVLTGEVQSCSEGLIALCPAPDLLPPLRDAFEDRLYALIARHRTAREMHTELELRTRAASLGVASVAAVEVLYHNRDRRPLQDVLTCIRHAKTLSTAGTMIRENAEHALLSIPAMKALFNDDPVSLARTLEVSERCQFSLDQLRYRYPGERIPNGMQEIDWLRIKTLEGAASRYPETIPPSVLAQVERELEIIHQLDYGGYFLTMWEIVQYCRDRGILCQGRGSAANSAVCYCLGITAIDPMHIDLLFERFLSLERAEPPDIDLDIEHQRREQVIQWVYERYGRKRAAMVANIIRYRARSSIREVGKALEIPQSALDRICKMLTHYDLDISSDLLSQSNLDPDEPRNMHLLQICREIIDFPRHLSIHPGGFLLGDQDIEALVPIEPATMEGRTVIQWDKYDIEDLGLFKIDLLGLGALSMVNRCFELLREHEKLELGIDRVPPEDPATYAMISRGDTVGVFQIESRAQMAMLPRLQPRTFYDLVIQVAIVRPGPIQGDMVHPYLLRRAGKELVDYPHPALQRALSKTLGIPIFQEQVMKLAVLVADYTPGEADQLRRDMAAWRSQGRIEEHRDRLLSRMIKNGIQKEFAERIFSQIQGFGEYGFPESHAASFALIAYVTAWLKCHYPAVFCCAALNSLPMGFYSAATLIHDAKRHGVRVLPIEIEHSQWECTLEPNPCSGEGTTYAIRMGYRFIKGFGQRQRTAVEAAQRQGPFSDAEDFVRRTRLSSKDLQLLAEAGALRFLAENRKEAIWTSRGMHAKLEDDLLLPTDIAPEDQRPTFAESSIGEAILWDYRTSMHSTRGHPLECIRPALRHRKIPVAEQVTQLPSGRATDYVGLVICRQRPGTASGVTFYTLEDETGFVNVVVWAHVFAKHMVVAKTAVLLGVHGKIQAQDGVVHLIADKLWAPDLHLDLVDTHPRSFH